MQTAMKKEEIYEKDMDLLILKKDLKSDIQRQSARKRALGIW